MALIHRHALRYAWRGTGCGGFSPRAGIRGFDTSEQSCRKSTGKRSIVSVPERGFVALIPRDHRHGLLGPEAGEGFSPRAGIRGFDTVSWMTTGRITMTVTIWLLGFSPRAGIRGFDTGAKLRLKVEGSTSVSFSFQSPSGDSWL